MMLDAIFEELCIYEEGPLCTQGLNGKDRWVLIYHNVRTDSVFIRVQGLWSQESAPMCSADNPKKPRSFSMPTLARPDLEITSLLEYFLR